MANFLTIYITLNLCLLCTYPSIINAARTVDSLVACLQRNKVLNYTTPSSSTSFNAVLDFSMQNLRFKEAGVSKPGAIILPSTTKEVQSTWACVRDGGWALRVRSGGHSYEGLSSTASTPFVIIDLMNMHAITVNVAKKFVWVESGVRLGELYYAIASASSNLLGLSAGTCATIGIEAQVITANGSLIKKVSTTDPDLFWALRGGGGDPELFIGIGRHLFRSSIYPELGLTASDCKQGYWIEEKGFW
ncbi:hypothetical protein GOP47_0011257 [Adiantum capillus-veneris]|uniref:FAD-binding PCMH-type domain-containing protein n=1 Tax=Adiantum capillus-veneris TaxID=13818 RepID=A0A9D4USV2_ADICA|nr:hypothetical protein GOP47_0011257 [Adiantum capillus-veneris]